MLCVWKRIYLFEVIQRVDAILAHLRNEGDAGDEHPVILLGNQATGGWQKHLHQLRHTSDDPKGAERRFLPDVRVRWLHQSLDLGRQIPRHFRRRDRTEGAQCQTDDELRRTVQVTVNRKGTKILVSFQKHMLEMLTSDENPELFVTFLNNSWSRDARPVVRPATAWLPDNRFVYLWISEKRWALNIPIDRNAPGI